jgi:uncharacterized protein DUF4440
MVSLLATFASALVALCLSGQGEPAPTLQAAPIASDADPQLTKELMRAEQDFWTATLHADAQSLDRIVGPEYTLRIADVPQGSLPRAIWMDNTLTKLHGETFELEHGAARRLADDLAAVGLRAKTKGTMDGRDLSGDFYLVDLWKKRGGTWQIIGRYSSPVGKPPQRANRPISQPADVDPALTDVLRPLEEELGRAALARFSDTKTVDRLVAPEFTLRMGDAPELSVPRASWGQPSGAYKMESLEERYHAARKLTDGLAAVSLILEQKAPRDDRDRSGEFYVVDIWKKHPNGWQLMARYSTPIGKTFDRSR